jgi:hypothetical protein
MRHISDHSASNHKIQVVTRLIECQSRPSTSMFRLKCLDIYYQMLSESSELIVLRPGHESLWYHRRSLHEMLLNALSDRDIFCFSLENDLVEDVCTFESRLTVVCDISVGSNRAQLSSSTLRTLFDALQEDVSHRFFVHHLLCSEASFLSSTLVKQELWDQKDQLLLASHYFRFSLCRVSFTDSLLFIFVSYSYSILSSHTM